MNEIDLTVKQLRKLDLILQRQAALNDLRTAHTNLDREVLSAFFANISNDLHCDTRAVF